MRKKIVGIALVFVVATIAVFNVYLNTKKNNMSLLALANVEALAGGDENDKEKGYTRVTSNCVVIIKGKADATITVAGIGVVKLDSNGEYRYTKVDGQVRCIQGGNELCMPQNC